jgi:uncharacterized cupredoxin-like copper-binding protein
MNLAILRKTNMRRKALIGQLPGIQHWLRYWAEWVNLRAIAPILLFLGVSLGGCTGWPGGAIAAAAPSHSVTVHLGTPAGALVFEPAQLQFKVGQRYKLVLDNPSPEKHYFTAKDFADTIWTQKVEAGNVEIKGAIHDIELRPEAVAEWYFVPQRAGEYALHCSIPGHAEAGMRGTITVTP